MMLNLNCLNARAERYSISSVSWWLCDCRPVPPFKVTNQIRELRWSKWVKSMRKDVECTFGVQCIVFTVLRCILP